MAAFQPDAQGLKQLADCLKSSLSGHDRTKQKQAELVSRTNTEHNTCCIAAHDCMRCVERYIADSY